MILQKQINNKIVKINKLMKEGNSIKNILDYILYILIIYS